MRTDERTLWTAAFLVMLSAATASCSSKGATGEQEPSRFTVSGTVSGLDGTLVLQLNGSAACSVTGNGPFSFATPLAAGGSYAVTVLSKPYGVQCRVSNGTGIVFHTDVTGIQITCSGMDRVVYTTHAASADLSSVFDDGTGEVALAASSADETFAGLAPDGRIIFSRTTGAQKDLFSVKADGTGLATLAASGSDEVFEAVDANDRVIYSRAGDLFSVATDGTDPVALATTADTETFAAVTPTGQVVYQRTVGGQTDLYVVGSDGQGTVALAADPTSNDAYQGIDPSGVVFFVRRTLAGATSGLWSVRTDGTGATSYPVGITCDHSDRQAADIAVVAFAPGGFVIFSRTADDSEVGGGYWLCSAKAGTVVELGSGGSMFATLAGVSPTGRVVVVQNQGGEYPVYDIHSVNPDGTGWIDLETDLGQEPRLAVAPDGRVVLETADGLVIMGADGTGRTSISTSGSDELQGFSPDGRIVFSPVATIGGWGGDLYSVEADGSDPRLLAPANNRFVAASSSARLIFSHAEGWDPLSYSYGATGLYSVYPDGTEARTLVDLGDGRQLDALAAWRPEWATSTIDAGVKAITGFSFVGASTGTTIDESAKTIHATVRHGTDVRALVASFSASGVRVSVAGVTQVSGLTRRDFSSPVQYVVTAANGTSVTYTVTVTVAPDTAKAITAFSFASLSATGQIDEESKSINVLVPAGTNVGALIATFTTNGVGVTVNAVPQVSGSTGNDFTSPVSYVVTAQDGTSATYVVTVTVAGAGP